MTVSTAGLDRAPPDGVADAGVRRLRLMRVPESQA